jgi:hypothetical protein
VAWASCSQGWPAAGTLKHRSEVGDNLSGRLKEKTKRVEDAERGRSMRLYALMHLGRRARTSAAPYLAHEGRTSSTPTVRLGPGCPVVVCCT